MKAALVLALALGACTFEDPGDPMTVDPTGTLADFATYVQPVLQGSCATLDCHGNAGRPLRLYAKNGLRAGVALRTKDATDDEMLANMASIAGIDPVAAKVEDNLLLLKPLSVAAGGIHHKGGDLWDDQSDNVYRCLHAWLRSGASDDAGRAVCMRAPLP